MDKKSKFDDDDVDDDDDFFEFHENASILISTVVFSKKRYLHSDWPLIVFQPASECLEREKLHWSLFFWHRALNNYLGNSSKL